MLQQLETTEYGWQWPYAANMGLPENVPIFTEWREQALSECLITGNTSGQTDILAEIAAFNLATQTPLQAMNTIAKWQEILRG